MMNKGIGVAAFFMLQALAWIAGFYAPVDRGSIYKAWIVLVGIIALWSIAIYKALPKLAWVGIGTVVIMPLARLLTAYQ